MERKRMKVLATIGLLFVAIFATMPAEARYDLKIVGDNTYYLANSASSDWKAGGNGVEPYLLKYWNTGSLLLTFGASKTPVTYGSIKATKIGDGECVAFVKALSNTNNIGSYKWKTGRKVMDIVNYGDLAQGTVVATFPSKDSYSGHVAVFDRWHWVYLGNYKWTVDGFYVWDQNYVATSLVGKQLFKQTGTGKSDADNYYVVQLE